ncbi:polymer-forming cytoskeletal protein [bacterium]|nr:polymer-forming cytoskeletal protein [bacterium]MBU1983692.1 polymer-forming cytoskeletal protein [bacterium]
MSKWSASASRAAIGGDISTLLSKDTEIRGSVKTQGPIRIDGSVIGDLTSAKTITIGATGVVDGNVTGEDVIIAGKVKGTLTARGKIALESTAQIEGDLHTSRLSIAEGAMFRGQSNMGSVTRPAARAIELDRDHGAPAKAERAAVG